MHVRNLKNLPPIVFRERSEVENVMCEVLCVPQASCLYTRRKSANRNLIIVHFGSKAAQNPCTNVESLKLLRPDPSAALRCGGAIILLCGRRVLTRASFHVNTLATHMLVGDGYMYL